MESYNDDDDIKPSIPVPRSVLLMQPIVPQLFHGLSSTDMTANNKQQQQQQQRVSAAGSKSASSQQQHDDVDERTQTTTDKSRRHSWTWKVTDVVTVPMFHPLERTAVVLKDIPLEEISARISIFMRLNSISCSYRTEMGHVDCLTPCLLKFSVQLWRSNNNNNNEAAPRKTTFNNNNNKNSNVDVILEVSRLQGCAIEMQRLRNWLVYTVTTGEQPLVPLFQEMGGGRCPSRVLRDMYEQYAHFVHANHNNNNDNNSKQEEEDEGYCRGALTVTIRLLQSNNLDQNRLGMESLCVLTNPSTVCEGDADWVAKAICFGKGEFGSQIQSVLATYFRKIERPDHHTEGSGMMMYDSGDECGFLDYEQGCSFGVMHNFGLQVLANSLERLVTRKDNDNDNNDETEVDVDTTSPFWQTILPALVYNMQVVENRPHEAALSAKIIGLLDNLEPMALDHFKEEGLLPVVMQAHEFGKLHHLTLERASGNLIRSLMTV